MDRTGGDVDGDLGEDGLVRDEVEVDGDGRVVVNGEVIYTKHDQT